MIKKEALVFLVVLELVKYGLQRSHRFKGSIFYVSNNAWLALLCLSIMMMLMITENSCLMMKKCMLLFMLLLKNAAQQLYQPWIIHVYIFPMQLHKAWKHQWDTMVEITGPLERGFGPSTYEKVYQSLLHKGKALIPCSWMLGFVYVQFMIIPFTTFFQTSICGWNVIDLVNLLSNNDQRLDLNVLRNLVS